MAERGVRGAIWRGMRSYLEGVLWLFRGKMAGFWLVFYGFLGEDESLVGLYFVDYLLFRGV